MEDSLDGFVLELLGWSPPEVDSLTVSPELPKGLVLICDIKREMEWGRESSPVTQQHVAGDSVLGCVYMCTYIRALHTYAHVQASVHTGT